VISDTGSGDEDLDDPPPNLEPKHCKKCGTAVGSGTVTTRFGEQPAYDVFVCAGCGFIEWVAVS
jgi:RNase P subunit RPR2